MKELQNGQKITYIRELGFGKIEKVTATVMMVMYNVALLDNGDEIPAIIVE